MKVVYRPRLLVDAQSIGVVVCHCAQQRHIMLLVACRTCVPVDPETRGTSGLYTLSRNTITAGVTVSIIADTTV